MSLTKNINDYKKHRANLKREQATHIKSDPSEVTSESIAAYKAIGAKIQECDDMIAQFEAELAEEAKTVKDDADDSFDDDGEEKTVKSFNIKKGAVSNTFTRGGKTYSGDIEKNLFGQFLLTKAIEKGLGRGMAKSFADKFLHGSVSKDLTAVDNPNFIPQDFVPEVQTGLYTNSVIRPSGARVFPTSGGNMILPLITGTTNATYFGEAAQGQASNMGVGNFHLGVHKLGTFTNLSNDFIRRTPLGVAAYLQDVMTRDLALFMDKSYLFGATNGPQGIINTPNINVFSDNVVSIVNGLNAGNTTNNGTELYFHVKQFLLSMETAMAAQNVPTDEAVWYMPIAVKNFLRGIVTFTGWAPFEEELANGELLGHKVLISNQIPTNISPDGSSTTLFLVVPRFLWIADTLNAEFRVSYDGSIQNAVGSTISAFGEDQSIYRLLYETDLGCAYPQSISVATLTGYLPTSFTPTGSVEVSFPTTNSTLGTVSQ
jgi:HK97 family phage major capsid protein